MKSRFLDYCHIFVAVVTLWLTFHFTKSLPFKYLIFTIVLFSLKPNIKEDIKRKTNIKDSVLAVFLFLLFSFALSFLFIPDNAEVNILSAVLAPIFEEIFFRKILTRNMSAPSDALLSSLVFALFHPLKVFVTTFLLGLSLFFIYKKCGLKTSITAHAVNNILAVFGSIILR